MAIAQKKNAFRGKDNGAQTFGMQAQQHQQLSTKLDGGGFTNLCGMCQSQWTSSGTTLQVLTRAAASFILPPMPANATSTNFCRPFSPLDQALHVRAIDHWRVPVPEYG
ncbi:unnamed protein product [Zymoseptoria tritici ST99CH_3D7]|uniref:Uncharacterized protein n=1 Tax=Zymoseptoria tritici (strain ST99CH_3D7) TaxID=1276538 RepID=A0A1X7RRH6_ZYMT9|nr:unnamed protein product [Zymoseptoria tritici ST99CH_3D7]